VAILIGFLIEQDASGAHVGEKQGQSNECNVPVVLFCWKRRQWESKKDASMQEVWQEVPQELLEILGST